jgi:large subunit ribosomal protein L47
MKIGERPLQEEVLRTHITNWRSLNLKQRKIILGFLNAKRSKDAKTSFLKELKILGQKIAHDQAQSRIQVS